MAARQFLASQAGIAHLYGALAQLGERNAGSVEVIGSIPIGSTILSSSSFVFFGFVVVCTGGELFYF